MRPGPPDRCQRRAPGGHPAECPERPRRQARGGFPVHRRRRGNRNRRRDGVNVLMGSLQKNSSQRFTVEAVRSEEHTSELQSLMRISYAVFCLKKKKIKIIIIYRLINN